MGRVNGEERNPTLYQLGVNSEAKLPASTRGSFWPSEPVGNGVLNMCTWSTCSLYVSGCWKLTHTQIISRVESKYVCNLHTSTGTS